MFYTEAVEVGRPAQSMQGRPCGVALFSMAGDGSLNAVWGMYGQDAAGSESWGKL